MRKSRVKRLLLCALVICAMLAAFLPRNTSAASRVLEIKPMYRLYNPNSGEHFYTASTAERNNVIAAGWNDEGIGWYAPTFSDTPVYRVYNPNSGDHHYTMSAGEKDHLVSIGWKDEGIGWYSDDQKSIPLYRQYNPNALTGNHNYTTSKAENDMLVRVGWNAEGIGWYGVNKNAPTPTPVPKRSVTFEKDPVYASIEGTLVLKGTGTGYHGKVVISSNAGTGSASFGVQYEENMSKHPDIRQVTTNNTVFLLENVMSHATTAGLQGKNYSYIETAEVGKSYKIRLSYTKEDKMLHCFVNDEEIYSEETTMTPPFIFAVEGSCAHNGDSIDATFTNVRVKCGDGLQSFNGKFSDYGTIGEWNDTNDYFGLNGTVTKQGETILDAGPTQTYYTVDGSGIAQEFHSYGANMRITGTADIDPKYDWDTCFQIVDPYSGAKGRPLSGIVNIAQQQ